MDKIQKVVWTIANFSTTTMLVFKTLFATNQPSCNKVLMLHMHSIWWLNILTSKLLHFKPLIHINLTFWHLSSCAWCTWFVASQPICAPPLVLDTQAPTYATRPIFATLGNVTLKGEKLQLDVRKPTLLCFYNLTQD
jgi:hypothetical protein